MTGSDCKKRLRRRKMDPKIKIVINNAAKLLYRMNGYQVDDGYDFSVASHPQERNMWNSALIMYCFFNEDFSLIKYQV
jgi:hypothetical protein